MVSDPTRLSCTEQGHIFLNSVLESSCNESYDKLVLKFERQVIFHISNVICTMCMKLYSVIIEFTWHKGTSEK